MMSRDEMRAWTPDHRATVFELRYHYTGLGGVLSLKCPFTAKLAVRAFADDRRVQGLSVTAIGDDGRPLPPTR